MTKKRNGRSVFAVISDRSAAAETRPTGHSLRLDCSSDQLLLVGCRRFRLDCCGSAVVEPFIETTFKLASGKSVRPDGLIRVTYGKQTVWTALVEIKVGSNKLSAEQINNYLEVAKAEKFDCVITTSNEIAPSPGVHPTDGLPKEGSSRS